MDTVRNRIKAVLEAVEQMIYSDRQPVISVKIAKADYHFEEEFHREGKDFRDFGLQNDRESWISLISSWQMWRSRSRWRGIQSVPC